MGYTLEAIIGPAAVLRTVVGRDSMVPAILVQLRQDMAMVPITDELFDAVTDGTPEKVLGFWTLPGGFDRVLADWSSTGPIGYVEADYFGGIGSQRAALWVDGRLEFGPVAVDVGQPSPAERTPISQVLARLGVYRTGHFDEFEAVGLRERRSTEDWLPH